LDRILPDFGIYRHQWYALGERLRYKHAVERIAMKMCEARSGVDVIEANGKQGRAKSFNVVHYARDGSAGDQKAAAAHFIQEFPNCCVTENKFICRVFQQQSHSVTEMFRLVDRPDYDVRVE